MATRRYKLPETGRELLTDFLLHYRAAAQRGLTIAAKSQQIRPMDQWVGMIRYWTDCVRCIDWLLSHAGHPGSVPEDP